MKKLWIVLGLGMAIITGCMIYLTKKGVPLRSAPIIAPTPVGVGIASMASAIAARLTPEFQTKHYVILGAPDNLEVRQLTAELGVALEKNNFGKPTWINSTGVTRESLLTCTKPCFVTSKYSEANELRPNRFFTEVIRPLNRPYFTLSIIYFSRNTEVPDYCEKQKRVDFECLIPLAVRETQRKMKNAERHFFMRQYNETDYFLFIERSKETES